jgi:hypothetical protein
MIQSPASEVHEVHGLTQFYERPVQAGFWQFSFCKARGSA